MTRARAIAGRLLCLGMLALLCGCGRAPRRPVCSFDVCTVDEWRCGDHRAAAFDGTLAVSCGMHVVLDSKAYCQSADPVVRVFNLRTGKLLHDLRNPNNALPESTTVTGTRRAFGGELCGEGNLLCVSGTDRCACNSSRTPGEPGEVYVYDIRSGEHIHTIACAEEEPKPGFGSLLALTRISHKQIDKERILPSKLNNDKQRKVGNIRSYGNTM